MKKLTAYPNTSSQEKDVILAKARIHNLTQKWIPASAGMTSALLAGLLTLTACAGDPSGTDDTTDDTVGERPATITPTWTADEGELATGDSPTSLVAPCPPPSSFRVGVRGLDLRTLPHTPANPTLAAPLTNTAAAP